MRIIIDREKWACLMISFLLDSIANKEEMIIENEDWLNIVHKLELGGLKAHLMQAYVRMDTERRVDYKRIKDVFYEDSKTQSVINIHGTSDLKEDTLYKYKLKDLLRESIRIVTKEKNKTGFAVSDEKIDRIIEHVINKQDTWSDE